MRFFIVVLLLTTASLFAQQNAAEFSLQAETTRLRVDAAKAGLDPRAKQALLVELAELLKLSGDNEGASLAWQEAAFAVPAVRNDAALLESAACFMAMGYWHEASEAVKLVLLTSREGSSVVYRAKYLQAQIEAFSKGDTSILEFYLNSPEYAAQKPSIYYTLYTITQKQDFRAVILAQYPLSPEARLLTDDAVPFPGAMWILYPGRESITIAR